MWRYFSMAMTLASALAEQFQKHLADDGRIDMVEVVQIVTTLIPRVAPLFGASFSNRQNETIETVMTVLQQIPGMIEDRKVTGQEFIDLGKKIADIYGVEFESDGIVF